MHAALTSAIILLCTPAAALQCRPLADMVKFEHDASGIETAITPSEWQFLRGIYAMNPQTPAGLPFGDHAVLVTVPQQEGAIVFFLDGDQACFPMRIPAVLLKIMDQVKSGEIPHEGSPI